MKKKVILGALAGFFLLLLIVIALLPGILSSNLMKPLVLGKVNQQMPGQIQVKEWSFGWLGSNEGKDIVYDNRKDALLVRVSEFKTSTGLLSLILGRGALGTIEVISPVVEFYIADSTKPQTTEESDASEPSSPPKTADQDKITIPAFYGQLIVSGGSILTVTAEGAKEVIAKDLNFVLDAQSPPEPITYRFSAESGDGSGRASGEGTFVLSSTDPLDIQKIKSDSKLRIQNLELEGISAIFASQKEMPVAKGRLNANVSLSGSSAESLRLLGKMSIDKLKLKGGPLVSDTPTVNGIAVDLDAIGDPNAISLKNLTFRSSLASGSAKGKFDGQGNNQLSGNADVNLAEVFTQLPGTLQLRKGTRILKGRMALSAKLESTREETYFAGDTRIDRLQGISNGKKLSWDKPVTVNARGKMRPDGLQLENLSLRSSFLNADGRGDMRNMQIKLSANIKAALKELKKFIELKQWDGSGDLKMDLQVNEKSTNLSKAALKLNIKDFVLNRNRSRILAKQNIRADLTTDMEMTEKLDRVKLLQPTINIKSTLAAGKFAATSLNAHPTGGVPNAADLNLDADVNLQQLSSLLKNLDKLSPDTQLGGRSKVKAKGSLKDGQLVLTSANIDSKKFSYRQNKKTIKEERVTLTTKGRIDINKRSLQLAPVDINAQAGKIHIPELVIDDWTNIQNKMKTSGKANLDLAKLTKGYGDFIGLPQKAQISGQSRFDFDVDFSHPKTQYLKLQGRIAPFKFVSEGLPTINEKNVTLNADAQRSPDGKHLTIKELQIKSNALSLTADGNLDQVGKNKVLKAKGTIAPDLSLLSAWLKKSGKAPIDLVGKKATPFTIKLTSKGDRWEDPLRHLNFAGAVHVSSMHAYGLKLTPNDIPININGAAAGAKLESPANGGQLSLQPAVNMKGDPFVLSFTKDLDILKEVQITQGVTEGLLALIHPLFKNAVKTEGQMGLHMEHFTWPLDPKAKNNASFAGSLKLDGVRLNSTPFLSGLLELMRIKERELYVDDQTVDFNAKNGRLTCSPLVLRVGEYPLKMQGSFGFDKTLDFVAWVPVTEGLVGKDAYQYLQGTTIKVPIRGTVSNPKFDESVLQEATASLVQQALQKNLQKGVQNLLENLLKKK